MSKKFWRTFLSVAIIISLFPFATAIPSRADATTVSVSYSTFVQKLGWQPSVSNGTISGTQGKSLRMQAFKASLTNSTGESSISYQSYMQSYGWIDPSADGDISGFVDKAKRTEAIRVSISGLDGYEVQYRVYQQSYGWSNWVSSKNGIGIENSPEAGITGKSKRIEAIEIKLLQVSNGSGSSDSSGSSQGSPSNMSDSEFQNYLNSNFGSLSINDSTASFTWAVNSFQISNTDETIMSDINSDQYSNWLNWRLNGYTSEIKDYFTKVATAIQLNYPNKTFFCNVIYQHEYDFYPTGYDYSEISFDAATGKWLVTHSVAILYCFDGSSVSINIQ